MPTPDTVFTLGSLLCCAAVFIGLLLVHIAVWRLFKVRKQILWLFIIFTGLPTLGLLIGLARGGDPIEWSLGYLLVFTLSSCYILFFPAVQYESPTLSMVRILDRNRSSGGLSRDEIMTTLCSDQPLRDRMEDLENNGLLGGATGPRRLSTAGRLVAAFFYYYRRLLGLPFGEG
jgi:hypothetical protein